MCSPAPDARSLSDAELGARLDELERTIRAIEAERGRCLAEVERRGLHAAEGQLSAAAWLARRHGIPQGTAAAQVRVARALEQMPRVARALARGEISTAAADAMARACEVGPEAFAQAEEAFVESARARSHHELRLELDRWRRDVDEERAARDEDDRHARRRFTAVVAADGMVRAEGELDPENGQYVITALRAKVDAWARQGTDDERIPAQRRADALGEICREWLDIAERPSLGGERPHVVVTMDLATLEARAGGRASLEEVGPITPSTARRLACDASVTRVITDARSMPLEVGRTTKVVSPALRRALAVRDGGCRFPGCERPPGWCDAHAGFNRSLQHLPQDGRSGRGRVERDRSKTACPCSDDPTALRSRIEARPFGSSPEHATAKAHPSGSSPEHGPAEPTALFDPTAPGDEGPAGRGRSAAPRGGADAMERAAADLRGLYE